VIGTIATGLMGLAPDAQSSTVETLPRLGDSVRWAKLTRVPLLRNEDHDRTPRGWYEHADQLQRSSLALEGQLSLKCHGAAFSYRCGRCACGRVRATAARSPSDYLGYAPCRESSCGRII